MRTPTKPGGIDPPGLVVASTIRDGDKEVVDDNDTKKVAGVVVVEASASQWW